MKITVRRIPSSYGRFAALEVLCNGNRVGLLDVNQEVTFASDKASTEVRVRVQNHEGSQPVIVAAQAGDVRLECGARIWPLFDVLNVSYLPGLKDHVYYLRRVNE